MFRRSSYLFKFRSDIIGAGKLQYQTKILYFEKEIICETIFEFITCLRAHSRLLHSGLPVGLGKRFYNGGHQFRFRPGRPSEWLPKQLLR